VYGGPKIRRSVAIDVRQVTTSFMSRSIASEAKSARCNEVDLQHAMINLRNLIRRRNPLNLLSPTISSVWLNLTHTPTLPLAPVNHKCDPE
jgi:hypothetical protein